MQAIEFPQQNEVIAKNQPEYIPLPAFLNIQQVRFKDGTEGPAVIDLTCCFQLSPEEIAQVIATGKIWYTQVVNNEAMQPIRMSVVDPFADMQLPDNWVKEMCERMKAVIESLAYSDQGKREIRAFIHDQFAPRHECGHNPVIRGVLLPGMPGFSEVAELQKQQAKKDGNGKR